MSRSLFLIFLLCGLVAVSVVFAYRARAATQPCSPRTPCIPNVKPPDCVKPDGDVARPLLHQLCEHQWRERIIGAAIRCPQSLCSVDVIREKLQTVQRVSTLDIMRAIGR